PILLAILGIVIGVFPSIIQDSLIQPAVTALGENGDEVQLKLWHGFNLILALSTTTIGLGALLYFLLKPSLKLENGIAKINAIAPQTLVENFGIGFGAISRLITGILQNGYLRYYVSTIILFLVVITGYTLL